MPIDEPPGPLVLDTHVWVWLVRGDKRLRPALPTIDRATAADRLRVSAISAWEIGMLTAKGRLQLSADPLDWVERALSAPGISLVPLTPRIAIEATRLPSPPDLRGDPADRIIAATARVLGATLLTRDAHLLAYAAAGHVRAMPV